MGCECFTVGQQIRGSIKDSTGRRHRTLDSTALLCSLGDKGLFSPFVVQNTIKKSSAKSRRSWREHQTDGWLSLGNPITKNIEPASIKGPITALRTDNGFGGSGLVRGNRGSQHVGLTLCGAAPSCRVRLLPWVTHESEPNRFAGTVIIPASPPSALFFFTNARAVFAVFPHVTRLG